MDPCVAGQNGSLEIKYRQKKRDKDTEDDKMVKQRGGSTPDFKLDGRRGSRVG